MTEASTAGLRRDIEDFTRTDPVFGGIVQTRSANRRDRTGGDRHP